MLCALYYGKFLNVDPANPHWPERDRFIARLSNIDAIVHNQDNREHDLLDSDDYYQFEGGMSAAFRSG